MGAEFLAMILIVVYVGAVAVLFPVCRHDARINFTELRKGALTYLPSVLLVGLILLVELVLILWRLGDFARRLSIEHWEPTPSADQSPTPMRSAWLSTRITVVFSVPGRRARAAGRHGRRHCADPSPAHRRSPPIHRQAGPNAGAAIPSRSKQVTSGSGVRS